MDTIKGLLLWFTNFSGKWSSRNSSRHTSREEIEIIIPILGNVIIYIVIYMKLHKRAAFLVSYISNVETLNLNQPSAKTKVFTKMMALVVGYLILDWSPYYIIIPLYKMNDPGTPTWYVYMFDFVSILLYTF